MLLRILFVSALLFISACQHSPRKEYFALSSPAIAAEQSTPTQPTQPKSAATNPIKVIGIGPLTIPEYLQHTRISYWKTSNQLMLQENHYWAEPLEQGISRVLGLGVQTAHADWRVVQFPWRNSQRPAYAVRVDIQRLDAFSDHAIIVVGMDLIDTKTRNIIRTTQFNSRVASAPHSAAIAQAFSELLQQTAARMDELLSVTEN
ncbi:MAG TPA: PqiC family protein [Cellvibrio sp.]|nr:PqiC family protein [Cellvibrio sp.]